MNARLGFILLAFVVAGGVIVTMWRTTSQGVEPVRTAGQPMHEEPVEESRFETSRTQHPKVGATIPRVAKPADDDNALVPTAYVTDDELSRLREAERQAFFQRLKSENLSVWDLRYADARLSTLLSDAKSREQFREWLLQEPFDDFRVAEAMMRLVARVDFDLFQSLTLAAADEGNSDLYAAALSAWPNEQAEAAPDQAIRAAAPALESENAYAQVYGLALLARADAKLPPSLREAVVELYEGPTQDTAVYNVSGHVLRGQGGLSADELRAAQQRLEQGTDPAAQYLAMMELVTPQPEQVTEDDDMAGRIANAAEHFAIALTALEIALHEPDLLVQLSAYIHYQSAATELDFLELYIEDPEAFQQYMDEH